MAPSGDACDAGGPQDRAGLQALVADVDDAAIDAIDRGAGAHGDAEPLEIASRAIAELRRERRQHVRPAFEEHHRRGPRIDGPELVPQRVPRDLDDGAGQLDAGRAAADDDERQPPPAFVIGRRPLGPLERHQHLRADRERVIERLEARGVGAPLVVAEVGVGHAGREDQVVERASARHR